MLVYVGWIEIRTASKTSGWLAGILVFDGTPLEGRNIFGFWIFRASWEALEEWRQYQDLILWYFRRERGMRHFF
jgi:hypothetical protein